MSVDVNGRENIAGAGINIAQRVMDCGDAGHILVSRRVADDLATSRRWQPLLHELGEVEVKHGVVVSLFNLYAEATGNPAPPVRFAAVKGAARPPGTAGPAQGRATWLIGRGARWCWSPPSPGAGWWWFAHKWPPGTRPPRPPPRCPPRRNRWPCCLSRT